MKITKPIRNMGLRMRKLRYLGHRFAENARTRGLSAALTRCIQYLKTNSDYHRRSVESQLRDVPRAVNIDADNSATQLIGSKASDMQQEQRLCSAIMTKPKLVFDLGMHNGDDSAYYLARGFHVVALEANPDLCQTNRKRFAREISAGLLHIEEKALYWSGGKEINFYISETNDEWSSADEWRVEGCGVVGQTVKIQTITLQELVKEHGIPHYVKCDLEGADEIFCEQLLESAEKPDFVSVEGISLDWVAMLRSAGYDCFQLINQARVRRYESNEVIESVYGRVEYGFGGSSSGRFGYDLSEDLWLPFQDAAFRWLKHEEIKMLDENMVLDNWFDYHATTKQTLNRRSEWPW